MKIIHEFSQTRRFLERDPFNPGNVLECEISMNKGHRYGALIIHKINGDKLKEPQVIYGTRKLSYPFDKNGNWHFPSALRIFSYRKYDGTNIFMYRYQYKGELFTTYKVRLFPFLRGPILKLWKRCLEMYPSIKRMFAYFPEANGFSFEMYGSDNPHLIEYNHDLEVRLLFAQKQKRSELIIIPPSHLMWGFDKGQQLYGFNIAEKLAYYEGDYVYNYQTEQDQHEINLTETDDGFKGEEGSVWYLQDKNKEWHLFKCKPNSIEKIHWAAYPLAPEVIKATAYNVLEVYEKVDYESLCELLLEEFPKQQIELSERRIRRIVEELDQKEQFKQRVKLAMVGLDANLKTVDILRQLSKKFDKKEMTSVYQAVVELTKESVTVN